MHTVHRSLFPGRKPICTGHDEYIRSFTASHNLLRRRSHDFARLRVDANDPQQSRRATLCCQIVSLRDDLFRQRLVRIGMRDLCGPRLRSRHDLEAGSKSTMVEASCLRMPASPSTLAVPSAIWASSVFAPIIVCSRSERLMVRVRSGSSPGSPRCSSAWHSPFR